MVLSTGGASRQLMHIDHVPAGRTVNYLCKGSFYALVNYRWLGSVLFSLYGSFGVPGGNVVIVLHYSYFYQVKGHLLVVCDATCK